MSTLNFKPFTKNDWDAFAGAEGKNPSIAYFTVGQYHAAAIADDAVLSVNFTNAEGNFEAEYALEVTGREQAEIVAGFIAWDKLTKLSDLELLGFSHCG